MCKSDNYPVVLKDFIDYLEHVKSKSPKTVETYASDISMMLRYIRWHKEFSKVIKIEDIDNRVDIEDIDVDFMRNIDIIDLERFIAYLSKTRNNAKSSQNKRIDAIKTFYKYLLKNKIVLENHSFELERVKASRREVESMSLEEAKSMVKAVKKDNEKTYSSRNYAILQVLLNCGLRLSELVSLNLDDIDHQEKTIQIVGKGDDERTIPIMIDETWEALMQWLEDREVLISKYGTNDLNAVFISREKNRISPDTVSKLIKDFAKLSGLDPKKLHTHLLRHSFATFLHDLGGVDIVDLKGLLGHKNISTTQIYVHTNKKGKREALKRMPSFID